MEDKMELIYYQLLQVENRLDKKIEYIEKAEKTIENAVLKLEKFYKELEKKGVIK